MAELKNVKVDCGRVVHHSGIVLAGEDIPCAAHIGGELVDFLDVLHDIAGDLLVTEITKGKLVGGRLSEVVGFYVCSAYPVAFGFQPLYQVAADKATGATDED